MKITIESTEAEPANRRKVILEIPDDDVVANDALDLAKRGLVAWGYHWSNIFDEEGGF